MYFGYFLGDRKLINPMNNPPVKYQLGEYNLPETCSSEISSYKCPPPEEQISSYKASGVNNGPPSTINSFYSTSYVAESTETQKASSNADDDNLESTETETSDFTTAHDAEKTSSDVKSSSEIPDSSEAASSANKYTEAANSPPKTSVWRILLLCCSAK